MRATSRPSQAEAPASQGARAARKGVEAGGGVRGGEDQGCHGAGAAAGGGAVQEGLHRAVQADGVVENQASGAAELDEVTDAGVVDGLAHGGAAEHEGFDAEEGGAVGQVHQELAVHGAAVEEDGFLGQPFQGGAGGDEEAGGDAGGGGDGEGAVVALGGLGGDGGVGAGAGGDAAVQRVAAGDAAGGVEGDGAGPGGAFGAGEADLEAAFLAEAVQDGGAVPLLEGEVQGAAGALVRGG